MRKIAAAPVPYKISHLIARLCFRGIYFPQKGSLAWFKVMIENRRVILRIIVECFTKWRGAAEAEVSLDFDTGARKPSRKRSQDSAEEAAAAHVPFVVLDAQKSYAAPGSTSSET
jgi:hypothetical protein